MKKLYLTLSIGLYGWLSVNAQCPSGVNFTNSTPLCTGSGVNFTNTSTVGTGVLYSYFWDFDVTGNGGVTPATSTAENPTGIIYTLPSSNVGSYDVQLTITEISSSCTKTKTRTININESPSASFSSTAPDCINNTVDFSNTGSSGGGSFTYSWNFGAGATPATSVSQNPTGIGYSSSGAITVGFTITSTAGCGSNTATNIINMYDPADASFTTSTNFGCVGQEVNFYDAGSAVELVHNWNFGSGATPATSTLQNPPPVTYSTSGAKYITHDVSNGPNNVGCSNNTVTQVISINPIPIASFTSTAPQCRGNAVNFTNTGTAGAGVTYAWDLGSGAIPAISSAQNPLGISYSTAGTKTITLTVYNQFGCSATATQTITINPTPVAIFTSTAPSCTADSVNFLNTGTTGATYAWNFGSGATPATSTTFSQNKVVYATAGIKSVMLITTLGTCTDTSRQTININQTPAPAFISDAPKCQGAAVAFNYTGTTGLGWTYNWDFGTGSSPALSSAQTPGSVIYTTAGTKNVTLTVTNNGTCPQAITNTITINPTPVANFTSTAPSCTADSVDFLNTGTSGATYAWNFGSGATPATSITFSQNKVVYATAGIKSVMLITTMGTCTDTSRQTININQTPAPAFTSTAPQCTGNAVAFNYTGTTGLGWTYNWDFGTGASPALSSAQNPGSILYSTSGIKTITITVTNDICSKSITGTITINPLPIANAGKDTVICNNLSVQIGSTPIAGNTYSWFPTSTLSNPNISNPVSSPIAPTTIYIVTVTNTATGCNSIDSVKVTMLAPLVANAGVDVEICRYDSIQVGTGLITAQNYSWSPSLGLSSITLPNPVASPAATTTYTVSVTGPGCGPVKDEVTITVHQLPLINAGIDDTITVGSNTQLIVTGGEQYTWSPSYGLSNIGIYNPIANPDSTTSYAVVGIDIYGCINKDTVMVKVLKPFFWVPTGFTPDGNGENDIFFVRGEGIKNFEFGIFNRWGEQIFYSKNQTQGWDGKRQISGEELPAGAYVYYIKGDLTNGYPINAKGIINLIR